MDLPHDDFAELVVVGSADRQNEINVAAYGKNRLDVGKLRERYCQVAPRNVPDLHDDDRRHVEADRFPVNVSAEPFEDTRSDEVLHPVVRGGPRDVYSLGDGADRPARVACQLRDDRAIGSVYRYGITVAPRTPAFSRAYSAAIPRPWSRRQRGRS